MRIHTAKQLLNVQQKMKHLNTAKKILGVITFMLKFEERKVQA